MLTEIKSGHITELIFSKLALIARNTKELLEFSEMFREHNGDLISLAESIDTPTPDGRPPYTMIAAIGNGSGKRLPSAWRHPLLVYV